MCAGFNFGKGHANEMFAPTLPLLASRWLASLCTSQGLQGSGRSRLMFIDFSKVFSHDERQHEVFFQLPDEDGESMAVQTLLWKQAMYGLRDAPLICQRSVQIMFGES